MFVAIMHIRLAKLFTTVLPIAGIWFLLTICSFKLNAQTITAYPMIPIARDTILFMSDQLPTGIQYWPFNSDSPKWDLNGVKAPYIRRLVAETEEAATDPFIHSNTMVYVNQSTREYLRITPDSVLTFGISGVDLFNDGNLYKGTYDVPRLYKNNRSIKSINSLGKYILKYDCGLLQLPVSIQNQLPYRPDSIRVITAIEEKSSLRPNVILDLNLQRYHTRIENRTIVQSTRLETRKSNLEWQDVTRFIRFPKLFKTDTIRVSSFYNDSIGSPVASLYYKTTEVVEKIVYRAPETFKDLIIVEDYKPNLFFFPNPYSVGTLRCEMIIKNPGLYTARVVNLIGKELWRQNYYLEYSKTIDLDFSYLNKGTYFFVLEQDKNHVIATKRLLVVRP